MPMLMNLLGSAGTPDPNSVPMNGPGAPPPPTAAAMPSPLSGIPSDITNPSPVIPTAPSPADQHQNRVQRAVRSILGTQVDYTVDPASGRTVAVPIKAKGSDIFRGILAGALLGAEAGQVAHNENPNSGFMTGFAAGGAGAIKQNTAVDAMRRQRAQEDFKNSIESRKADQELLLQQAQIAHMHAEDLHAQAMMDLMASDHLQKINDANSVLAAQYENKGTVGDVVVNGKNINGQLGNGYDLMRAVNKDPHSLDAPTGYHRVWTYHVDTTGLKYTPGRGWVDKDGNNVDMATRTANTAYDIPNSSMNEIVKNKDGKMMTGREINKMLGTVLFPNTDEPRPITYGDLIGLKDKATKEAREAAQTDLERSKISYEIAMTKKQTQLLQSELDKNKDRDIRADVDVLKSILEGQKEQLKSASSSMDAEAVKQANKDIQDTENQLKSLLVRSPNPAPNTAPTTTAAPPPPNPVDAAYGFLSTKPRDQQLAMIDSSANLSVSQKAELKKRLGLDSTGGMPLPATETVGGVPYTAAQAAADQAAAARQRQVDLQRQQAADQARAQRF